MTNLYAFMSSDFHYINLNPLNRSGSMLLALDKDAINALADAIESNICVYEHAHNLLYPIADPQFRARIPFPW